MNDLDVQQALGLRYRTSLEADGRTESLRRDLALDTKAQVARLAIGRSLAMGALDEASIDSQGKDIPATSLFAPENMGAWIGLLVSHSLSNEGPLIDSMDGLRGAIRAHWHRGALALWRDWENCDLNYDKFVETLVTRRSDMPEFGPAQGGQADDEPSGNAPKSLPADASQALTKALDELGIQVQVKDALQGPRITGYRVLLHNLADSAKLKRSMPQLGLALNLGNAVPLLANGDEAKTVFIDLPRPKATWKTVGVERLRDWAAGMPRDPNQLMLYAGVSVTGEDVAFNLATAPHLLVGGTTGSGKSVCLHSFLISLLLKHKGDSLQLALIDPKQVDLAPYAKLKNLYHGTVATEVAQAREMLKALIAEMEARYGAFSKIGATNIAEARRQGQSLPFIVVVVEEMADLVIQDPGIEPLIARLAQKARAAGIHLILATQRPDAETFSGLIRSNIPARVALMVGKESESVIILDEKGAKDLLGSGDMLIRFPGEPLLRAHGVYVQIDAVAQVVTAAAR